MSYEKLLRPWIESGHLFLNPESLPYEHIKKVVISPKSLINLACDLNGYVEVEKFTHSKWYAKDAPVGTLFIVDEDDLEVEGETLRASIAECLNTLTQNGYVLIVPNTAELVMTSGFINQKAKVSETVDSADIYDKMYTGFTLMTGKVAEGGWHPCVCNDCDNCDEPCQFYKEGSKQELILGRYAELFHKLDIVNALDKDLRAVMNGFCDEAISTAIAGVSEYSSADDAIVDALEVLIASCYSAYPELVNRIVSAMFAEFEVDKEASEEGFEEAEDTAEDIVEVDSEEEAIAKEEVVSEEGGQIILSKEVAVEDPEMITVNEEIKDECNVQKYKNGDSSEGVRETNSEEDECIEDATEGTEEIEVGRNSEVQLEDSADGFSIPSKEEAVETLKEIESDANVAVANAIDNVQEGAAGLFNSFKDAVSEAWSRLQEKESEEPVVEDIPQQDSYIGISMGGTTSMFSDALNSSEVSSAYEESGDIIIQNEDAEDLEAEVIEVNSESAAENSADVEKVPATAGTSDADEATAAKTFSIGGVTVNEEELSKYSDEEKETIFDMISEDLSEEDAATLRDYLMSI